AVGVQGDEDLVGEARKRLVDGVVNHLVDHVVKARAVVGVADIHARPLAHGIEAFQHFDRLRAVLGSGSGFAFRSWRHGSLNGSCWSFRRSRRHHLNEVLIIPRFTAKIWASCAIGANRSRSVPVIQAWAQSLEISAKSTSLRT